MPRSLRAVLTGLLVAVSCSLLLLAQRGPVVGAADADTLRAAGDLKWYRGNIHTHSLWSDGDEYPEMIALWYRDHGYQFLGFTDHNVLPTREKWIDVLKSKGKQAAYDALKARFPEGWVDERMTDGRLEVRLKRFDEVSERVGRPGEFLLIQGEEISDKFGRLPIHLCANNVQEVIPPLGGGSVYEVLQNNVDAVNSQRARTGRPMIVHINHPNFHYALTAEDLMRVRGDKFFEVYNGHPTVYNSGDAQHASTDRIWDIVLTKRIAELDLPVMYGLAVDDGHNYHNIPSRASNPGRGWIMVLADKLAPESLIAAMEHGRFYASSGVTLDRVTASRRGLEVAVKAEPGVTYTIEFIGTRRGYDASSEPVRDKEGKPLPVTRRYSDDVGAVLARVEGTEAEYKFTGDELYVRARIISSKPHPNPSEPGEFERAWVQPAVGPGAPQSK